MSILGAVAISQPLRPQSRSKPISKDPLLIHDGLAFRPGCGLRPNDNECLLHRLGKLDTSHATYQRLNARKEGFE